MLTKCADSQSGSRADNKKHKKRKSQTGWSRGEKRGGKGPDELRMEVFQISKHPTTSFPF